MPYRYWHLWSGICFLQKLRTGPGSAYMRTMRYEPCLAPREPNRSTLVEPGCIRWLKSTPQISYCCSHPHRARPRWPFSTKHGQQLWHSYWLNSLCDTGSIRNSEVDLICNLRNTGHHIAAEGEQSFSARWVSN